MLIPNYNINDLQAFLPSEYSTMLFKAEMTVFGKENGTWIEMGTLTWGFSFTDGSITPISPMKTYTGL
jgi:hypothetical protein